MFGKKEKEIPAIAPELTAYIRDATAQTAALMGHPAPVTKPKPPRPHETPPRTFVGTTRNNLTRSYDAYVAELELIDKDIEKLQEEKRQIEVSLTALRAALDTMDTAEDGAYSPDEATLNAAMDASDGGTE